MQVDIVKEEELFNELAAIFKNESGEELFSSAQTVVFELLSLSEFKKAVKMGYSLKLLVNVSLGGKDYVRGGPLYWP